VTKVSRFSTSAAVLLLLAVVPSSAQSPTRCSADKVGSLACITVDLTNSNAKQLGLPQFGTGADTGISLISGQLSSAAPLPAPASGFVYTFDPTAGVFTQSAASYGPILSERADTVGFHRISFGFVDQFFDFTKVDGIPISNVPVNVPLASNAYLAGNYDLRFRLNQFTMFGTYGLTDRLEVSVAAPILNAQLGGSLNEVGHFGPLTASASTTVHRSATGFGDLQFRAKANLIRSEHVDIALGVNVRTPTGDPYALLGAGAMGIEPFLAASTTLRGRFTPHVNVGYQWNGASVLAGDVASGTKRNLPGNISYAAGGEIGINRRLTIAEDLIGTELIHAERAVIGPYSQYDGTTIQSVSFFRKSFNSTSVSSGLKLNIGGNLLLSLNLLTRVNNGGLRAAVVPLVGLSYVFQTPTVTGPTPRLPKDTGIPPRVPPARGPELAKATIPEAVAAPAIGAATTRDISPMALAARQNEWQANLDRMVQELNPKANFATSAPPAFIPFHKGAYLKLSVTTTLPKTASGSQYRLAALAFDQHIAHLIRPVVEYLAAHQDYDGIDFSTSVRLAGDPASNASPMLVDFIVPRNLLPEYAQFDRTGQQLIDASYVLINGERVSLNLEIAEAGFPAQ